MVVGERVLLGQRKVVQRLVTQAREVDAFAQIDQWGADKAFFVNRNPLYEVPEECQM